MLLFNDTLNTFMICGFRHMVKHNLNSKLKPAVATLSDYSSFTCIIPHTGEYIPRSLLHQLWSTGWNGKQLNVFVMRDRSNNPSNHEWMIYYFFFSVYPDFNNIANFGNSYPVILMKRVNNFLWRDCLDAFRYFSPYFTTLIFSLIKKTFCNSKWYQKGIFQITDVFIKKGARCSSVVRAFAHHAMARRIDPSWWTHLAIPRSSQCSTTGVIKAVVCFILSVG